MHSSVSLVFAVVLLLSAGAPASGVATATSDAETVPASAHAEPSASAPDSVSAADESAEGNDACAPVANGSRTPDPDEDVLGWENGCWYDADLAVNRTDGLNRTERDAVVARAMARVERVRQLEFEGTVPVEVISRAEYENRTAEGFAAESSAERLRENVKWEAVLMVGEDADALAVQRSNAVASVGGYYSLAEDRIFVVSDDRASPKLDEVTLAHELVHALQEQQFDVSDRFDVSNFDYGEHTTDSLNGLNGLLEGDARLVEMRYRERCSGEWDCLPGDRRESGGDRHEGLYFVNVQPYSDGPHFVNAIREERGWEGVDAAYDDPPVSAAQVANPEKYPDEEPANVDFTDRSRGEWRVLDPGPGRPDHVSFGLSAITPMLIYPLYDLGSQDEPVMPARLFFNATPEGLSTYDPYQYADNPFASGFAGDELYPYVTDESVETGETGYVWKLAWETEDDAQRFVEGYVDLLAYYNATEVDGRENTYRIPEGDRYGDAFYVERSGDTVTIVNAPSVEALSQIRPGAAPEVEETTGETETDTVLDVPGFGAFAALAALAGVILVAHRRR